MTNIGILIAVWFAENFVTLLTILVCLVIIYWLLRVFIIDGNSETLSEVKK